MLDAKVPWIGFKIQGDFYSRFWNENKVWFMVSCNLGFVLVTMAMYHLSPNIYFVYTFLGSKIRRSSRADVLTLMHDVWGLTREAWRLKAASLTCMAVAAAIELMDSISSVEPCLCEVSPCQLAWDSSQQWCLGSQGKHPERVRARTNGATFITCHQKAHAVTSATVFIEAVTMSSDANGG